jgi:hypothetical protein
MCVKDIIFPLFLLFVLLDIKTILTVWLFFVLFFFIFYLVYIRIGPNICNLVLFNILSGQSNLSCIKDHFLSYS